MSSFEYSSVTGLRSPYTSATILRFLHIRVAVHGGPRERHHDHQEAAVSVMAIQERDHNHTDLCGTQAATPAAPLCAEQGRARPVGHRHQ